MPLEWFNVKQATAAGAALADQLIEQALPSADKRREPLQSGKLVKELFRHTDRALQPLRLNFFKRAKLANSFKWRLLECGVDKQIADDVTQALVLRLMGGGAAGGAEPAVAVTDRKQSEPSVKQLLASGNDSFRRGDYPQALQLYERLLELKPRNADTHNNVGATLFRLERFGEALRHFRQALKLRPEFPEALSNLGAAQLWAGDYADAEVSLRHALKLSPRYVDARSLLGRALLLQGRVKDARAHFTKALAGDPKDIEALIGLGEAASMEGQFEDADRQLRRALEIEPNPRAASTMAMLARLRRMTPADKPWLEQALKLAESSLPVTEEAALRFAIGKYYDDIGEYSRAFPVFKRANELSRSVGFDYSREARTKFVDDLLRLYDAAYLSAPNPAASDSRAPVLVIGMPRSGTTLVEQIIASHPQARGAGELGFWNATGRPRGLDPRNPSLTSALQKDMSRDYLKALTQQAGEAERVVDKAPLNTDLVGLIHKVFPRAKFIHVRRNAIDTCLSCYFQPFAPTLIYSTDLEDLAHYYRQHLRLLEHWRSVVPADVLLDVSYEDLVADPVRGSRQLLDFIGLDWDDRCLEFYKTERGVVTASSWQVRQKIYATSVERWRHYEKFIGPLLSLRKLDA